MPSVLNIKRLANHEPGLWPRQLALLTSEPSLAGEVLIGDIDKHGLKGLIFADMPSPKKRAVAYADCPTLPPALQGPWDGEWVMPLTFKAGSRGERKCLWAEKLLPCRRLRSV